MAKIIVAVKGAGGQLITENEAPVHAPAVPPITRGKLAVLLKCMHMF